MKLRADQIVQAKALLVELNPLVAQELDWLLRMASAPSAKRAALYEEWEPQSSQISTLEEDQTNALSEFLMDILHQGRLLELLASLERLLMLGIQPTLVEFAELSQELLKKPWPLSRTELKIVRMLHEDPTDSAVAIAQATGFHRQTVANYIRRLYFALQIQSYPLVNYHALGLRRIQIWFRGTAEIPTSVYFYSRLALTGSNKRWLIDTWSVPENAEELLLEYYQKMERTGQIHDLTAREVLSFGKHLSLSTYEESSGWRSEPEVIKQVYQRALEGQDSYIPRLLEVMVYGATSSSKLDAIDIRIIEALWKDYLLGQTKEAAAIRLGISRSSFSRRLQQLESIGVIKPSLWLKTEDMVQAAFTIPISETQVLNALMCLPVVYFYLIEAKESGERHWFVVTKSTPAVANVFANYNGHSNGLQTFNTHIIQQRNGKRLFKAYNKDTNSWMTELLITGAQNHF